MCLFVNYSLLTLSVLTEVSGCRFDLESACREAASIASLVVSAVPWSQWDHPKNKTRCHAGEKKKHILL